MTTSARFGRQSPGNAADLPGWSRPAPCCAAAVDPSSGARRRTPGHLPRHQTGSRPWRCSSTRHRDTRSSRSRCAACGDYVTKEKPGATLYAALLLCRKLEISTPCYLIRAILMTEGPQPPTEERRPTKKRRRTRRRPLIVVPPIVLYPEDVSIFSPADSKKHPLTMDQFGIGIHALAEQEFPNAIKFRPKSLKKRIHKTIDKHFPQAPPGAHHKAQITKAEKMCLKQKEVAPDKDVNWYPIAVACIRG
jgi:hypothetical protein